MMRFDFNLVIVDDEYDDIDQRTNVTDLIEKLQLAVTSKGFTLKAKCYPNSESAHLDAHNRIDLYLSDNNLGDSHGHADSSKKNDGIDFYLKLRQQKYLCDFVLYTKSPTQEIINKLVSDLNKEQNPNLFSRFTFVSREHGGEYWHEPILNLLNHILTKREEINNLRGLYAQRVSRIDLDLKEKYPETSHLDLYETINAIPVIDKISKRRLHEVRIIRNGLLHIEEERCTTRHQYVVRIKGADNAIRYEVYEDELQKYRDKLIEACVIVESLP